MPKCKVIFAWALRKLIFENNIDGISRLLKTVEAIKVQNGLSKIVYGLEPTGNYHKPLAAHLIRCDCNVVLVTGQAVFVPFNGLNILPIERVFVQACTCLSLTKLCHGQIVESG